MAMIEAHPCPDSEVWCPNEKTALMGNDMAGCLPSAFVSRMREQLPEEAEDFFACYDQEAETGIRINTGKVSVEEALGGLPFALQHIPWADNGFYLEHGVTASRHPWYFAGLYYIQEPSAMLPAKLLPIEPGNIVLDLCAAPGGKSTELLSRLKGEGILISNDVSASRAKALVKNLALWGAPNACITSETPQRLLEAFGCCFDRILVDAPCSGEGMFRKDRGLIGAWQKKGPAEYAPLQKEILSCAVRMLKPGGMLLYSTCTFSEDEDEAVIADALAGNPELSLVSPAAYLNSMEGFSPGRPPKALPDGVYGFERCIRLYPHRVRGEGHFMALLQKRAVQNDLEALPTGQDSGSATKTVRREKHTMLPDAVRDFLTVITDRSHMFSDLVGKYRYTQIEEQCLLVPPYPLPGGIRYLRTGIRIGTLKKDRFEPSQELAMFLNADSFDMVLDLSAEDMRTTRYLKGETIEWNAGEIAGYEESMRCPKKPGAGWVLICVDGHGLGWGRLMEGSIKNKYYPGWRVQ